MGNAGGRIGRTSPSRGNKNVGRDGKWGPEGSIRRGFERRLEGIGRRAIGKATPLNGNRRYLVRPGGTRMEMVTTSPTRPTGNLAGIWHNRSREALASQLGAIRAESRRVGVVTSPKITYNSVQQRYEVRSFVRQGSGPHPGGITRAQLREGRVLSSAGTRKMTASRLRANARAEARRSSGTSTSRRSTTRGSTTRRSTTRTPARTTRATRSTTRRATTRSSTRRTRTSRRRQSSRAERRRRGR